MLSPVRLALCLASIWAIAFVCVAGATANDTPAPRGCTPMGYESIALDQPLDIDEVRVRLHDRSPPDGAVAVVLGTGYGDRTIHVSGQKLHSLVFAPALRSDSYEISIEPVFEINAGACVAEVTLLHHGQPMMRFYPQPAP